MKLNILTVVIFITVFFNIACQQVHQSILTVDRGSYSGSSEVLRKPSYIISDSAEVRGNPSAFVHLFEWTWSDIAQECRDFLGPNGYSAVQVSPPNEHAILDYVEGRVKFPWYQRYQPVSYQLISRSGDAKAFESMVKSCADHGVDIYVDAVINHMASVLAEGEERRGIGSSKFYHYSYPDYEKSNFNFCGTPNNDIGSYQDRYQVQNCELLNLADLKTSSEYVRGTISDYLANLLRIGVKGFRIDAAKHMPREDIVAIIDLATSKSGVKPYIFQEVIDQGGEPITSREYVSVEHDVTEFKYSLNLGRVFYNQSLAVLNEPLGFGESWGFLKSADSVVFTDNHDNQRGHGGGGQVLSHKNPQLYKLANVFMLAWPYGYPKVMSSYHFNDPSVGPPSLEGGVTLKVHGDNELRCGTGLWVCEHRWPELSKMVQFRNLIQNEDVNSWFSNGDNFISFSRGNRGFIAINRHDYDVTYTVPTGLKAGIYCNFLAGDKCEQTIEVGDDGKVQIQLPALTALAVYK